ncbi:hypothetical protein J3D55_001538 [Chryseobacterium ginsenosidimutans]|jgi:hypothetical protein|uniref:hypothetical protein n=1 Tax=Chryseobacterium ginsenosidimutans TaxID=687846 RepID=UPI00216A1B19|nr:hypothetical protein [Chryseobacterium ginsenosidimutans]MCS3868622.1 hypothetical protein [Chryseobacterium ginsenosidimutans]
MKTIPEDFIEFLYWIKNETETLWSQDPEIFHFEKWLHGAKWIGMTDSQIAKAEEKYSIKFTPEHKEFLRILHTVDRKEKIEDTTDDGQIVIHEYPYFYNWLKDHEDIIYRLKYPFECILYDIKKRSMWLKSWGEKPKDKNEQIEKFTEIYHQSPPLLPLYNHRFLVSDTSLKFNPVLSIWGTDTIIYGWTLRTYLINELKYYLDIWKNVYNEEDQQYYSHLNNEAKKISDDDFKYDKDKVIPIWQEIILDYNNFWSSFGLKNPPNPKLESLKRSIENENKI